MKGNFFPGGSDRRNGSTNYASMIATALRTELGDSHRAAKTVMRWTGASERTIKHWLAGHHGPRGEHLVVLMRESEAVFEAVMTAAGRRDTVVAARMLAARGAMVDAMSLVGREGFRLSDGYSTGAEQSDPPAASRLHDRNDGRTNDPMNDRNRTDAVSTSADGLNPRQRWCLGMLSAGKEVRADDFRRRWSVSEKTARRDIAALKRRGMIEFVGPLRTGRYRLRR